MSTHIQTLLAELTIAEKCRLLGGASSWRTHPIERLGIPAIKMTDGPNGARGEFTAGARTPSLVVPVQILLGATWDTELVGKVGELLGRETRRRTAHVLLAPGVNLHRTPIGGRTFEYYSEDPALTSALAVAAVRGIQSNGVAVTVKHFVGNDTEVDRHTVDVRIDERVLHELYLAPFEAAVRDGGAWGVMTGYNRLDGTYCAENQALLTRILRGDWGYDGFVVSDWYGAHDPVGSLRAGLDVEMPGPARVYGEHLEAEIAAGNVDAALLDDRVAALLRLIERTGATDRSADEPEVTVDDPDERRLCRVTAIAGTVLAKNRAAALPLGGDRPVQSVALIGPNAASTRIMGGGSSALRPLPFRSLAEAVLDRVPGAAFERGCAIDRYTPLPPLSQLVGPDGAPGLEARFINGTDPDAEPANVLRLDEPTIRFFGSVPAGVGPGAIVVTVRGSFRAVVDGEHHVGVIVAGAADIRIGEQLVADADHPLPPGDAFYGFGSQEQSSAVVLAAGETVPIEVTLRLPRPFGGVRIGVREPVAGDEMAGAVALAERSDAAVVVVGTTDEWETEGSDRASIALPGDQDELVRRIAAVNDRTIVVVNAGAPVAMPWADEVDAIVLPFFGGIEMADAVVDVLLGDADPGGRLPITFPHRLEDAPAWPTYPPVEGVQHYAEGFNIGYRGHDAGGVAPLFAFGHGLSYGTAEWGSPTVVRTEITVGDLTAGETVAVDVSLAAAGVRDATVVVQGYVAAVDPPVEREQKALRAWHKLVVPAGDTATAHLQFGHDAFRRWEPGTGWVVDPGDYDLVIAASAVDIRGTVRLRITG